MKLRVFILFFLPAIFQAQLITSTSMSPTQLVQNILLGPGVEISNISFSGSNQAIGHFTANGTNLGINEGIVITTGTVVGNNGPIGPNDDASSGTDNNFGGSTLLNSLLSAGNETYNASTLEFDFEAVGDEVSFKYVFGSEEYLEYVSAGFNDVFALFINGPGYNNENIARLPNNTIVSIDNVNDQSNSFYYVDNGTGEQSPYNSSTQYIQYDGFTKVLVAQANVQCGEKYHLTIAIADVGDGILDSGIFLEAQSLKSNEPYASDFSISQMHFGADDIVAEGCTFADIVVSREDATALVNIPIQVLGSATEGVDYADVPSQITFNPGQTEFTFNFDIFYDGINENTETVQLILMLVNECLELDPDTITLEIRNVNPIEVNLVADSLNCGPGEIITISPIVTGGLEPFNYMWSTFETTPSITISPPSTQTYSVTVTDACLNTTDTDDAEIFVADIPPLEFLPFPTVSVLCPNTPQFLTAVATGGSGGYSYIWKQQNFFLNQTDTITLSPLQTTVYTVTVTDLCGLQTTINVPFEVQTPMLIPEITTPEPICPSDTVQITASATLGLGQYTYFWVHSEETTNTVEVSPNKTTNYTVLISDECQSYSVPISTTVVVFDPVANFSFSTSNLETGAQIQFEDNSINAVNYFWDLGNGTQSTDKDPITQYNEVGTYEVTLIIQDELGCYDTITKPINIGFLLFIPNTFTPDGNKYNNEFFAVSVNIEVLSFEIFNRWGETVFYAENETRFRWDGSYNNQECPDGIYTYKIRYLNPSRDEIVFVGHVNLLR